MQKSGKSQEKFRKKLTEALLKIRNTEGKTLELIQTEVGAAIGRSRHTIEHWRKENSSMPKGEELTSLALILFERGGLNRADVAALLAYAGHCDFEKISAELPVEAPPTDLVNGPEKGPGAERDDQAYWPQSAHIFRAAGRVFWGLITHRLRTIPTWLPFLVVLLLGLMLLGRYTWGQSQERGWAVKINQSDDVNLIMLEGHILQANHGSASEWMRLAPYQNEPQSLELIFANLNGPGVGIWDYELRFEGNALWREKGGTQAAFGFGNRARLELTPDGKWGITNIIPEKGTAHIDSQWHANLAGYGIIILSVDGVPVAGSYPSGLGIFDRYDISAYITPGERHEISLSVWNHKKGDYHWLATITHNDRLIWQDGGTGSSKRQAEVFFKSFWIDEAGQISP